MKRNIETMHFNKHKGELHPHVSFGLFLILLGVALLVATNDLLNLGEVSNYFTWQTVLIFIGVLLILNLNFTGGVLFIAGGFWFLMDELSLELPAYFNTIYWPSVIILVGLGLIISSLLKRNRTKQF
ncbi:MAG: hypothetical protein RBU28_08700, partial [Bacteroidales bacterium]|jgi:hypothetical protein|nr:hypothetical protein [Bacteroidales bacterium]